MTAFYDIVSITFAAICLALVEAYSLLTTSHLIGSFP